MYKNYIYCDYSKTIRKMPQNYWIATIRNNELIFDSWDGKAEELYAKFCFKLFIRIGWFMGLIKTEKRRVKKYFIQHEYDKDLCFTQDEAETKKFVEKQIKEHDENYSPPMTEEEKENWLTDLEFLELGGKLVVDDYDITRIE